MKKVLTYSTPRNQRVPPLVRLARALRWTVAPLTAGILAAILVDLGNFQNWYGFSSYYGGFLGTHWLDSFLYGAHDPATAVATIELVWFFYAAAATAFQGLLYLLWQYWKVRRPPPPY